MNRKISQIILSISFALLAISLVLNALGDKKQSKKISCLEKGRVYIGDDFCFDFKNKLRIKL